MPSSIKEAWPTHTLAQAPECLSKNAFKHTHLGVSSSAAFEVEISRFVQDSSRSYANFCFVLSGRFTNPSRRFNHQCQKGSSGDFQEQGQDWHGLFWQGWRPMANRR
jgi:hypothetical protein